MSIFFWVGIFFFGAIIGSFFNVVLIRKNTSESMASGGSRCLSCGNSLCWYEMIPIISFLIQQAKCRHCGSAISWQYPIVELATGLLAVSMYIKFADFSFAFFYFGAFSVLLLLAAYDIRQKIIDTHFLYVFGVFAVVEAGMRWYQNTELLLVDLIASFGIAFFFYFLWRISMGTWMGRGDADLVFVIGLFLGFPYNMGMLLMSFWLGGIVGIMLLLLVHRRFKLKSEVPFGPFLVVGAFFVWYFAYYFDITYRFYFS